MSVSNLNEFPVHNITLNITSIQLTVLIVGLLKFMLLQILLHRKRISSFLLGFKSHFYEDKIINFVPSENLEKKVDDEISTTVCCKGEAEIVLKSLGIFSQDEKLPARFDGYEILDIFEEREPSLDEVREAFDVFDSNRDGFIDGMELQRIMCGLGLKEGLEMENCRRMIGAFDEDGDGRIDFAEFVKFMENSLCN